MHRRQGDIQSSELQERVLTKGGEGKGAGFIDGAVCMEQRISMYED